MFPELEQYREKPDLEQYRGSGLQPGEDWTIPIEDEHPELAATTRLKLKSLADTGPKTMLKNLEKEGFEARHRGGMSFSIRKPGEDKWYVVDPSTFELLDDPLEFLASILPSAVGTGVGGSLGAVGGAAGSIVGAGAGASIGEGAKMGLGKLLGLEYDPGEVGGRLEAELALGGAAQAAAPILSKLGAGAKRTLFGEPAVQRVLGEGFKPGERAALKKLGMRPGPEAGNRIVKTGIRPGPERIVRQKPYADLTPPLTSPGREGLLPGAGRLAREGLEKVPEEFRAGVTRGAGKLKKGTAAALETAGHAVGVPGRVMDAVIKKFRDIITPGETASGGYFAGPGLGLGIAYGMGVGPAATKGLIAGMGSKLAEAGLKKTAKILMGNPKVLLAHANKAKGAIANKLRKPIQALETRGQEAYVAAIYTMMHDPAVRAYLKGEEDE